MRGFFSYPLPGIPANFVDYVDYETANSGGLVGYQEGATSMGIDTITVIPANGRKPGRVTSQASFTHGVQNRQKRTVCHLRTQVPRNRSEVHPNATTERYVCQEDEASPEGLDK